MTALPTRTVVVALSVSLLVTAARPASAQDPAGPEARPTMKIGPVELWPTMTFRNIGVDNNVFNEPENPKSDFTLTVVPNLTALVRPDWMRLSYTSLSEFVYFATYKSERGINRGFDARFDLFLPFAQPYLTAGAMLTKERPNREIDERAPRQLRSYSAGLRFKLGTVSSVSAGVRRNTSRYVEAGRLFRGIDLGEELNNETDGVEAAFQVDLTPLTTVGVTVARQEDRFDTKPLRNSDSLRVTPTVLFKPFGLFSGSASVGYLRFDAVDPDVEDYAGFVANGSIGFLLLDRYRFETTFGHDMRYSYDEQTPTYVGKSIAASLRTDLFGGLDVKVSSARDVMAYRALAGQQAPPADIHFMYGAGLGYTLITNMRLGVEAEFWQRTSDRAGRGYRNNRIFATLNWGVTPQ